MATGGLGSGPRGLVPAPATIERVMRLLWSLPGRGLEARAALNGLLGDALAESDSPLAIPMTFVTLSGEDVPVDRAALREAFPHAGDRLCVLVHGLMSTESVWRYAGAGSVSHGERLAAEHGVTPVYVRYNTGRHISTNGRELALRVQALVRAWPERVREIDLIGHSMGGLVVRSACHYGRHSATLSDRVRRRGPWPARVRRVVLLGAPNSGANLEVVANLTSAALWAIPSPVTRLIGAGLARRSDGIKDLRWGAVVDDDWVEVDPDATVRPRRHPVRVPRRARYLVVAGSLVGRQDADDPGLVDRLLGDALVTTTSAHGLPGEGEPALFPNRTVRLCPRINHVALANHPAVLAEIAGWWDGDQ